MRPMNPIFDLYFWPTPNGYKISIMLEELGVDYQVVPINITEGEQHEERFDMVSPNHKIPALTHYVGGERAPVHLFESGAILLYLGDWSKRFIPTEARAYRDCLMWLMWQMGGLGPMAGQAHHFLQYAREDLPYAKERYRAECRRLYAVLEKRLTGRDFVAGEYSIADIAIVAWVYRHQRHEIDLAHYPEVRSWYERLLARSAVQSGFEVGRALVEKGNFTSDRAQSVLFGEDQAE